MDDPTVPAATAEAATGGLVNMGLTCYANSVIQVLRKNKKLAWILQEGRYNTLFQSDAVAKPRRKAQQELVRSFAEVLKMLGQCVAGQSVRPGEFWNRVAHSVNDTMYEHLATKAPHDAHEFYLFLLESLHESTATEVEMRITRAPPSTPQDKLVIQALESWSREFSKEYSPFVDLLYGLGHWRTVCQRCKNVSHRWESFNTLKVSVPKGGLGVEPAKIADLLAGEMEPESIADYDCEVCRARTEARRSYSIWRLPATVVLVLKRFTPDGRKIHTRVAPLEGEGELDFAPFFSEESPERSGATRYRLQSIVDHHGSSGGGHYTAQVREDGAGKWTLYDDEGISPLPHTIYGDSTYILFLERVGGGSA